MFHGMMIRFLKTASFGLIATAFAYPANLTAAPKPQSLGTFKDWAAYTYNTAKSKVCYIVSQPTSSKPTGVNRDPVFFIITHRPGDRVRNEANTIIGYPFKKGSTASVTIDNASNFKFFTSGDGAWAGTKQADNKVVATMRAGSTMVIKGRSGRGTLTTDKYSLAGVSAALKKIDEVCR
jgi:invasion protein IalB